MPFLKLETFAGPYRTWTSCPCRNRYRFSSFSDNKTRPPLRTAHSASNVIRFCHKPIRIDRIIDNTQEASRVLHVADADG